MRSILGGPRILDRRFDLAGTLKKPRRAALSAAQCPFFPAEEPGSGGFKGTNRASELAADCAVGLPESWPDSGKNKSFPEGKVASAAMPEATFPSAAR